MRTAQGLLKATRIHYIPLMIMRCLRYLLTVAVLLSILTPMSAAALASMGVGDTRVLVICTGDGLRTIVVGENETPVDISEDAEFCALVTAADTHSPARAETPAQPLLVALSASQARSLTPPKTAKLSSLPRAPPVA